MVPDPVALGEGFEEGNEEEKILADEFGDLVLCGTEALTVGGGGVRVVVVGRNVGELAGEDIAEQEAAVVPYCVVLWVLGEQGGGELESGVGVVAGFDLGWISVIPCDRGTRYVGSILCPSHPSPAPCMRRFACAPCRAQRRSCRWESSRRRGVHHAGRRGQRVPFIFLAPTSSPPRHLHLPPSLSLRRVRGLSHALLLMLIKAPAVWVNLAMKGSRICPISGEGKSRWSRDCAVHVVATAAMLFAFTSCAGFAHLNIRC